MDRKKGESTTNDDPLWQVWRRQRDDHVQGTVWTDMAWTDGFAIRIDGDFDSDLADTQNGCANGTRLPAQYRHFLRGDGHQQGKCDSYERSEPNHDASISLRLGLEKGQRVAGFAGSENEKAQTVKSGL
jgi:hypothetical protein